MWLATLLAMLPATRTSHREGDTSPATTARPTTGSGHSPLPRSARPLPVAARASLTTASQPATPRRPTSTTATMRSSTSSTGSSPSGAGRRPGRPGPTRWCSCPAQCRTASSCPTPGPAAPCSSPHREASTNSSATSGPRRHGARCPALAATCLPPSRSPQPQRRTASAQRSTSDRPAATNHRHRRNGDDHEQRTDNSLQRSEHRRVPRQRRTTSDLRLRARSAVDHDWGEVWATTRQPDDVSGRRPRREPDLRFRLSRGVRQQPGLVPQPRRQPARCGRRSGHGQPEGRRGRASRTGPSHCVRRAGQAVLRLRALPVHDTTPDPRRRLEPEVGPSTTATSPPWRSARGAGG